jgi:hypothetical protein
MLNEWVWQYIKIQEVCEILFFSLLSIVIFIGNLIT